MWGRRQVQRRSAQVAIGAPDGVQAALRRDGSRPTARGSPSGAENAGIDIRSYRDHPFGGVEAGTRTALSFLSVMYGCSAAARQLYIRCLPCGTDGVSDGRFARQSGFLSRGDEGSFSPPAAS